MSDFALEYPASPGTRGFASIPRALSRLSSRVWYSILVPLSGWWTFYVWRRYLPHGLANLREHLEPLTQFPHPLLWKPWWWDLLAAGALTFAALCVGGWLLSHLPLKVGNGERLLLAPAVGFMALVLAASALGLAGVFHVWPLRILAALLAAAALPRIPAELRFLARCAASGAARLWAEPLAALALALAIPFFFFGLVASALPETSFDALNVYLSHPRLYLQQGNFFSVDLYRGFTPLYAQVFYALGLALRGPGLARFLNFLVLPATALAVLLLARRLAGDLRGTTAGALAILFLVSAPSVLFHSTICYPDLGMVFWVLLSLYALFRYLDSPQRPGWLIIAGTSAGMAAGLKYCGLYVVVVLVILLAAAAWSRRGWQHAARSVLIFSALVVIVGGPWYFRNAYLTGDPFHPLLQRFLPQPVLSPVEVRDLLDDGMNYQRFPATFENLLKLPWLVTLKGDKLLGTIGPVFLWTLPFILLSLRRERVWLGTLASAAALALLFFLGPQWLRYSLPVVPLLCALAGASLVRPGRRWLLPLALLLPLVNLIGLNEFWVGGGSNVLYQVRYDVAFGATTPEQYQRHEIPGFETVQYWNRLPLSENARVLPVPILAFFPPALSRLEVLDIFENGHAVCRQEGFLDCYTMASPALLARMDEHRVQLVAIRENLEYLTPTGALRLEDPLLRSEFRLLGYTGGTFLYQRRPKGPVAGESYVNADLLHRWGTRDGAGLIAGIKPALEGYWPWGADQRLALMFTSPTEIQWDVSLGRQPRLALVMSAASPHQVTIRVAAGTRTESVTCRAEASSGWEPCIMDLSSFAGRRVQVTLAASSVAVADPVIYAQESGKPVPLPADGKVMFSANPNPVIVTDGTGLGVTTLTWNAPQASRVEVRVGAENGPKLAYGGSSGSVVTGKWVTKGMVYLRDVSDASRPKTLAALRLRVVHAKPSSSD